VISVFAVFAAGDWPVVWRVLVICAGLVALAQVSLRAGERAWLRWQRHRRALAGLMDRGDGQGGVPGLARRERDLPRLARAIGTVERRTRAMSAAELDAVHGPGLGELVSQDRLITEQWRAAFGEMTDALTPRMVAPTRADLAAIDAVQVNGGRNGNLGDLDPDPDLGERR
jgi:hypothetical protein